MAVTHRLRRSLVALPANEQRLAADAADSDADEVVFALEDSLAPRVIPGLALNERQRV